MKGSKSSDSSCWKEKMFKTRLKCLHDDQKSVWIFSTDVFDPMDLCILRLPGWSHWWHPAQQLVGGDFLTVFSLFGHKMHNQDVSLMPCRREMMPLLSLIFSALFILFGTVVIQAFRSVALTCTLHTTTRATEKIACLCFSVTQVKINRVNQRQKMEQKLKMSLQGPLVLQGKNACVISSFHFLIAVTILTLA